MKIDQATPSTIQALWESIEPDVKRSPTLEGAAQAFVAGLYT